MKKRIDSYDSLVTEVKRLQKYSGFAYNVGSGLGVADTATTSAIVAPTSGLSLYNELKTGKRSLAQIDVDGMIASFQPSILTRQIMYWEALGNNGGTINTWAFNGYSTVGTLTGRTQAAGNILTQARRLGFVTAAGAGSMAEWLYNGLQYWRGNGARQGGFFIGYRFGIAQTGTNYRFFCGLSSNQAAFTNIDQSAQINAISILKDGADTPLQFAVNDGSGTATKTTTGITPPSTGITIYEVRFFCPPNGTTVYISIQDLSTDISTEFSATADIPANTQFLCPRIWISNNATAASVAFDLQKIYAETFF